MNLKLKLEVNLDFIHFELSPNFLLFMADDIDDLLDEAEEALAETTIATTYEAIQANPNRLVPSQLHVTLLSAI